MGSGETAPAMVRIHRDVIGRTPNGSHVMLDTPFGFQDNADDLTARTRKYFQESVGVDVELAGWRRADSPSSARDTTLAQLAEAEWAFAGPGSPTYAMEHWTGTPVPGALTDLLTRGGTVVLGSAAAVTGGAAALPVYEIYKVGAEPFWAAGLDLLGKVTGISAAVIPHYNNAEGGTYDTRYCYLGERRLALLEQQLSPESVVLGVDEHTAVIFDLDRERVEVAGAGALTVRRQGRSTVLPAGTSLTVTELGSVARGEPAGVEESTSSWEVSQPTTAPEPGQPSLEAAVSRLRAEFDRGVEARQLAVCVTAVLDLEQAIHDWSADTLQSDSADRGRRELRAMVVRLGDLAEGGAVDPRAQVAPVVETLLEIRARARSEQDFALSDLIRERLAGAGIEVRDTPEGVGWDLTPDGE